MIKQMNTLDEQKPIGKIFFFAVVIYPIPDHMIIDLCQKGRAADCLFGSLSYLIFAQHFCNNVLHCKNIKYDAF